MNIRTLFSTTMIFSFLVTLIPVKTQADPQLQKLLFYAGAAIIGVGVISAAQAKPRTGVTLVLVGAGMAAASTPDQTRQLFDKLIGRTTTERTLNTIEANAKAFYNWWSKV